MTDSHASFSLLPADGNDANGGIKSGPRRRG